MSRFTLTVFTFLLACVTSRSQAFDWQSLAGPPGVLERLAYNQDGRMLMLNRQLTRDFRFFVSNDDGVRWSALPPLPQSNQSYVPYVAANGDLYLYSRQSLYNWREQSQSWELLSEELLFDNLSLVERNHLICEASRRIYSSSDSGRNWSQVRPSDGLPPQGELRLYPSMNKNRIYLASADELFYSGSVDGPWRSLPLPQGTVPSFELSHQGAIVAANTDSLFLWDAAAERWTLLCRRSPELRLRYARDAAGKLFGLSLDGELFAYRPAPPAWELIRNNRQRPVKLLVLSSRDELLSTFNGRLAGLDKSTGNLEFRDAGIDDGSVLQFVVTPEGRAFVHQGDKVLHNKDLGVLWHSIDLPFEGRVRYNSLTWLSNSDELLATINDSLFAISASGDDWRFVSEAPETIVNVIELEDGLLLESEQVLLRTDFAMREFQYLEPNYFHQFRQTSPGFIIGFRDVSSIGGAESIAFSSDAGRNWRYTSLPTANVRQLIARSDSIWLLNTTDGLLRTSDFGVSWTSILPPDSLGSLELQTLGGSALLMYNRSGDNSLWFSPDEGRTRTRLPGEDHVRFTSFALHDSVLYGGTWRHGLRRLTIAHLLPADPADSTGQPDDNPSDGSDTARVNAELVIRPNPVSAAAQLAITLPRDGRISITLHDISGRAFTLVGDRFYRDGSYILNWDGSRFAPGLYFLSMRTKEQSISSPVFIMR